jgi:molybdate transport system substrate-binding protein
MRIIQSSLMAGALVVAAARMAAQAPVAEIRVISPGVVYNAGLLDLAASFEKETRTKVTVTSVGMGRIVNEITTVAQPPDVIMLPFELMSTLSLDGGVKAGTFMPLGRAEMGLAVPAGARHPDISTVEKVIKRPEFAGVNSPVSTRGEGGQALARGEGDMALQAICEILPYKEIELVGPLPRELAAWIDMSTAVSARSQDPDRALAFIRYITRAEATPVWTAKGLKRF